MLPPACGTIAVAFARFVFTGTILRLQWHDSFPQTYVMLPLFSFYQKTFLLSPNIYARDKIQ